MKQTLSGLLIAALAIISCRKNNDTPTPEPTFHLNVSTALIQAGSAPSNVDVTIDANSDWKITLPAGIDWLGVNKNTGTTDDVVQVKLTKENNTGVKRTATITIELVNGKAPAKQITVEQDFVIATPVQIVWKKAYGGNGNDYGYSIIKTPDGGSLLSGRTTSNNGDITSIHGGIDMWVVKLNGAGAIEWQKTYGGNADEYSVAAAATPDGGYVLTGFTLSNNNGDVGANHGNTDFWVVKINATGTILWQKTLGGDNDDRPLAVTITTEGRIGVAGFTNSINNGDVGQNHGSQDMWVMLLDNGNGNFLWKKTFGGNHDDEATALAPAPDGGLYVGGTTFSNNNGDIGPTKGSSDFYVLHLDRNLSIVWKNSFGGSNIEDLSSLAVGPNNTLVAAGSTKSSNSGDVGTGKGGEDMWVVQINATTGALIWQKVFGGIGGEVAKGVVVKANGNIYVSGYTYSNLSGDVPANNGAGEFYILGLNSAGAVIWNRFLGGNNEELGFSIAETADGVVVSGSTLSHNSGDVGPNHGNSDIWVVRLKDQ